MQILLSNSQAGLGRKVKQEQEEFSRNHVQAFIPGSVSNNLMKASHTREVYIAVPWAIAAFFMLTTLALTIGGVVVFCCMNKKQGRPVSPEGGRPQKW